MKILLGMMLVLFLVAVPASHAQMANGADSAAITQTAMNLVNAFNNHDAAAWSALFVMDGQTNNMGGNATNGRDAIMKNYTNLFSGGLKTATDMLMLRPIHTFSDSVAEVDGDIQRVGGAKSLWTLIMVKQNGQWMIATFHEQPAGAPGGGAAPAGGGAPAGAPAAGPQ